VACILKVSFNQYAGHTSKGCTSPFADLDQRNGEAAELNQSTVADEQRDNQAINVKAT
jgi:hypothetical protein